MKRFIIIDGTTGDRLSYLLYAKNGKKAIEEFLSSTPQKYIPSPCRYHTTAVIDGSKSIITAIEL